MATNYVKQILLNFGYDEASMKRINEALHRIFSLNDKNNSSRKSFDEGLKGISKAYNSSVNKTLQELSSSYKSVTDELSEELASSLKRDDISQQYSDDIQSITEKIKELNEAKLEGKVIDNAELDTLKKTKSLLESKYSDYKKKLEKPTDSQQFFSLVKDLGKSVGDMFIDKIPLFNDIKNNLPDNFDELNNKMKLASVGFSILKTGAEKAIDYLVNGFKKAMSKIKEMASYDTANSIEYNQNAVELQLQTGLQGAELYGLQAGLDKMGFSSLDEYFENLPFMNENQLENMEEEIRAATEEWNKLYNSGYFDKVEEYNEAMKDFKRDFEYALMDFMIDNKDLIISTMNMIIEAMPMLLNFVKGILNFLGIGNSYEGVSDSVTSDIISNYVNNNGGNDNRTYNTSVSNTFNNGNDTSQLQADNLSKLIRIQLLKAMEGNI